MKIGRITLIDRGLASGDKWGPEIDNRLSRIFEERPEFITILVHNRDELRAAFIRLCDEEKCPLVVTTGGTGPGPHDIVPDITREMAERDLPGFGEAIRNASFTRGPIALLSRAVAGVRGTTLILNLPSRPNAIFGCLKLLRESIVECIEQLTGIRYALYHDPVVIPLEKVLPFLKRFRIKPDPRWE